MLPFPSKSSIVFNPARSISKKFGPLLRNDEVRRKKTGLSVGARKQLSCLNRYLLIRRTSADRTVSWVAHERTEGIDYRQDGGRVRSLLELGARSECSEW